ncbi:hypothetical protein HMI54_013423, partial [Coelomomyces lativittatus]
NLTAEEIRDISRTDEPESSFITLEELLNSTLVVAEAYYTATGKPFRVEIEMKGKPSVDNPAYAKNLTDSVAKTISKFKKSNRGKYLEFIIFNGSETDALSYDSVRKSKSRLGNLYTGLGSSDTVTGKTSKHPIQDTSPHPVSPMVFKKLEWTPSTAELENRLTTLNGIKSRASDAEFTTFLTTHHLTKPSGPRFNTFTKQINKIIADIKSRRDYQNKVDADMEAGGGGDAAMIDTLLARHDLSNVHLLTDTPSNAEPYKEKTT